MVVVMVVIGVGSRQRTKRERKKMYKVLMVYDNILGASQSDDE
jgi:hypothetical protein